MKPRGAGGAAVAPTHVITAGSVSRSLSSVGRRRAPERAGSPRERGRAEKERNENTANKYVVHPKRNENANETQRRPPRTSAEVRGGGGEGREEGREEGRRHKNKTKQNKTKQNKTKQNETKQKQNIVKRTGTKRNETELSKMKRNRTEQSKTK